MKLFHIYNYDDFVAALLEAGFTMGAGNSEGVFAMVPWDWQTEPPYDTPVCWHSGDPVTDPWEWRMRVLDERRDIAYGKVFFKKSGYITREWYPYFYAARRGGRVFDEEYALGTISHPAKRIYEAVCEYKNLPVHGIKAVAGFGREDKSAFDQGLTELQMKMYLTMCGRQQKLSAKGEEYGWSSTVFCPVEDFFDRDMLAQAEHITESEAVEKLTEQILKLNPEAQQKKILKFIKG